MAGPTLPTSNGGFKTALLFGGGIVLTIVAVAALVVLWPDSDAGDQVVSEGSTTTAVEPTDASTGSTTGEPSNATSTTIGPAPAQLFESGAAGAVAEMRDAAGDPLQAIQIAIYPSYAFLSYRSHTEPSHIDRRSWRDGKDQDDAAPNPIDDRVDADTEPGLFPLAGIDLSILPRLVDDAEGRFGTEVLVTHVLVDRFLPFDQRVLYRVYATPTDGRSGDGYVQYTLDGTYVKTVQ